MDGIRRILAPNSGAFTQKDIVEDSGVIVKLFIGDVNPIPKEALLGSQVDLREVNASIPPWMRALCPTPLETWRLWSGSSGTALLR